MFYVSRRRSDISVLVKQVKKEASLRGKQIKTIDPIVISAKRLFPYLPDPVLLEYSRTAFRVIRNDVVNQTLVDAPQTTLLTYFTPQ